MDGEGSLKPRCVSGGVSGIGETDCTQGVHRKCRKAVVSDQWNQWTAVSPGCRVSWNHARRLCSIVWSGGEPMGIRCIGGEEFSWGVFLRWKGWMGKPNGLSHFRKERRTERFLLSEGSGRSHQFSKEGS